MGNAIRLAFALVFAAFAASILLYPAMPERIAVHWNAAGAADGFSGRAFGLFLLPSITLLLCALLTALPRMDPLKANIDLFRGAYEGFVLAFAMFMCYLHALTLLAGLGHGFNMVVALLPAFAGLMYLIGSVFRVAKRNWFIGIRTPWTLSSDEVWGRTHALGATLFQACAAFTLLGLAAPDYAILFLVGPALLSAAILVPYSYLEFRKVPGPGAKR